MEKIEEKFCEFKDGKTYIKVRATVKASKNVISGVKNGELLVSVTSVPENNKANDAIIKILSKEFNVAKTKLQIVSGSKSRNKILCIDEQILISGIFKK